MKRCLTCNAHYPSSVIDCPDCGLGPVLVDGFYAYAPELAFEADGFKPSYFSELAGFEEDYFWFNSRNQLILWALEEYCPSFGAFLEIGCGTGYVLSGVAKAFPHATVHGSEIFTTGLDFAVKRLPFVNFIQMDARNIPFTEEFDVIGAFDVLEHIEEDGQVLAQVHAALKPQGFMLLTVPQHAWLWSPTDEYACHVRRYSALCLHQKIEAAGFQVVRSTSFVTSLLPAMMASRFIKKKKAVEALDVTAELKISSRLNSFFAKLLSAEIALIRSGISFPAGGSRFVLARKAKG